MDWGWAFWGVIVLAVGIQGVFWPAAFRDWSMKFSDMSGLLKYPPRNPMPLPKWRKLGWIWIVGSAIIFWLALGHPTKL